MCVWYKSLAKVRSPSNLHKIAFWSCDEVLVWLKKNCSRSFKLYGKLFKEHCITGVFIAAAF